MSRIDVRLYHLLQKFLPLVVPDILWKRTARYMFGIYLFYAKWLRPLLMCGQASSERLVEYSWVLRKLRHKRGSLLDIGCGDSLLDYKLVDLGFKVYAIDLNYHPSLRKKTGFTFVQADITNAPFEDGSFEWILAISTIEHIENDIGCMKEIRRLLIEDGIVLITIPLGKGFYRLT